MSPPCRAWPERTPARMPASPNRVPGGRGSTAAAGCGSEGARWTESTGTSPAYGAPWPTLSGDTTASTPRSGIRSACQTSPMPLR
jgi:hypothetical protein